MATVADLIKSSLRAIGAIASGEPVSAAEQADAIDTLNDILEDWSNDGFMLSEEKIEEFDLVPGTGTYLFGTGAAFDSVRPSMILGAKIKLTDGGERHLSTLTIQEWANVNHRTTLGGFPSSLYYNPTFPSGEINLWPIPDKADKISIYSRKPLTAVTSGATVITYPPGYKMALKYTLACALAPEYGKPSDPKLEDMAMKAKLGIQRSNTQPVVMQSDAVGLFSRSIKTDIFGAG